MTKIKYTHKTKDGRKARLVCTDMVGTQNLLVLVKYKDEEVPHSYSNNLKFYESGNPSDMDLEEMSVWEDVAVDTPIWVFNHYDGKWTPEHFAKYHNGEVYIYGNGRTSHSGYSSVARKSKDCTLDVADTLVLHITHCKNGFNNV